MATASTNNRNLPPLALSVRQPWAWAIIHGGKVIENRSFGSIKAGNMDCRTICIHAASGMKQVEFDWGYWRLAKHGVACPRPDELVRSAIIGIVDVVDIITDSDSEWFGGQAGLVLDNPRAIEPIACVGALGYFEWAPAGLFSPIKPWMSKWQPPSEATLDLFGGSEPPKPFGKTKPAS
ncbi:MAG: hypothetical protein WA921_06150 [Ahrensia sp.]